MPRSDCKISYNIDVLQKGRTKDSTFRTAGPDEEREIMLTLHDRQFADKGWNIFQKNGSTKSSRNSTT